MNTVETEVTLKIYPRPKETILLDIPKDTLNSLQQVANNRDMSIESLMKLYIGQGLREDLTH